MWTTHDNGNADPADRISYSVSARDHSSHRADAVKLDIFLLHEPNQLGIVERLGVAVDQQNLVSRRRKRFQQKHPKVRHEVARYAVVGTIEKYFHRLPIYQD